MKRDFKFVVFVLAQRVYPSGIGVVAAVNGGRWKKHEPGESFQPQMQKVEYCWNSGDIKSCVCFPGWVEWGEALFLF